MLSKHGLLSTKILYNLNFFFWFLLLLLFHMLASYLRLINCVIRIEMRDTENSNNKLQTPVSKSDIHLIEFTCTFVVIDFMYISSFVPSLLVFASFSFDFVLVVVVVVVVWCVFFTLYCPICIIALMPVCYAMPVYKQIHRWWHK